MFATNLCEVVKKSSAPKKEEKSGKRARDIIANSSCYLPCWASHFTGPPLVCSPIPAENAGLTSLGRGEGPTAAIPG